MKTHLTFTIKVFYVCVSYIRFIYFITIIKEISKLRFELIIQDLDIVTKRLEKIELEIKKAPKTKVQKEGEIKLLELLRKRLEEEKFPSAESLNLDEHQKILTRPNKNYLK